MRDLTERWVVLLSGLPAVGKTTVASALADYHSFEQLDVGSVLHRFVPDVVERPAVGPTFVRRFGVEQIASILLDQLAQTERAVVVDAIRMPITCREIVDSDVGLVAIVYIDAPESIRQERLRARYENRVQSLEMQASYDEEAEEVRAMASIVVDNVGSRAELRLRAGELSTALQTGHISPIRSGPSR